MKVVQRLKDAFKAAIRSGKIFYVGAIEETYTSDKIPAFNVLNFEQWKLLEKNERCFRSHLASKKYNFGGFICKGNLESWINIFKILNGIFYKNNEFLLTKSNYLQWSTQFLKFTARILSKSPRHQNNLEQGNNNKLQFIKNQLNFINNVLLPFFSQRQVISERRETSRDKLIDLWINKRNKTIQVIKNDGYSPQKNRVEIPMEETELYYEQLRKYVIEENFIMRENSVAHDEGVPVELLTYAEVQKSLSSSSTGKSPGIDGVRYEDIKNNWDEYGEDIVRLFNIILTNKKSPISWKYAIIQLNPKKNFNRNDLSTLRDISLLPPLYNVFSRCLCNRLIEFISNEVSFWQRAYLEKRDLQELIFNLISYAVQKLEIH